MPELIQWHKPPPVGGGVMLLDLVERNQLLTLIFLGQ